METTCERRHASQAVRVAFRGGLAAKRTTRDLLSDVLERHADEVVIERDAHGKPYLAFPDVGTRFSVARTNGLAIVAMTPCHDVGVDVESLDRDVTGWAMWHHVMTAAELAAIPDDPDARNAALLQAWVRKEALLKAAGVGLAIDPATVELAEEEIYHLPSQLGSPREWSMADVVFPGFVGAVACRAPSCSIEVTGAMIV